MTLVIATVAFAAGALFSGAFAARELRRQARFLERRDPSGNERARSSIPLGAPRRLARAINAFVEGARRESESARNRNDELMRNMSDLSHDIRTPLAAAKGHLQLLASGTGSTPAPGGHLDAAMARIDATTVILDQMIELTRANDPDRIYTCKPVLLLSALVDALDNHAQDFEKLGWVPVVSFAQEGIRVEADVQALNRILENLVTNALRYGLPPLSCIQSTSNDEVVLILSNGIDNKDAPDLDVLFDRFYRTENSRTGTGTGLGLPIAKALSEKMGMRLSANLGEGVIEFELAMRTEPPTPH